MDSVCLRDIPGIQNAELDFWKAAAYRSSDRGVKGTGYVSVLFIYDSDGQLFAIYYESKDKRNVFYPGSPGFEHYASLWEKDKEFYETVAPDWAVELAREHPEYAMKIYHNCGRGVRERDVREWVEQRVVCKDNSQ